jgi:hypothetical protein
MLRLIKKSAYVIYERPQSSSSEESEDMDQDEGQNESNLQSPSKAKKTYMTVKLIGRKGYSDNYSSSSDDSNSPSPSPVTYKASSNPAGSTPGAANADYPLKTEVESSKIGITIKKSPTSYETKPLSGSKNIFKSSSSNQQAKTTPAATDSSEESESEANSDSDSDSEVTINTSSLSIGGPNSNKRKSIFALSRTPAKNPQVHLSKFDLLTQSPDKKKTEKVDLTKKDSIISMASLIGSEAEDSESPIVEPMDQGNLLKGIDICSGGPTKPKRVLLTSVSIVICIYFNFYNFSLLQTMLAIYHIWFPFRKSFLEKVI